MKKFATCAALAGLVAATACVETIAQDQPVEARAETPACIQPQYPPKAMRDGKEGVVEAGFLIGPDGTAQESVVVTTSGAPELDRATLVSLGKCRFKPAMVNGQPITGWQILLYKWELDPPQEASPEFLSAVENGPPAAQYLLSLMYRKGFRVDQDQQAARRWLQVAAERGFAMAQFHLGAAYERGDGVAQDDAQALSWYRKAAAKGNAFAREKLRFGFGGIAAEPEAKN
jgi:TonB family protein